MPRLFSWDMEQPLLIHRPKRRRMEVKGQEVRTATNMYYNHELCIIILFRINWTQCYNVLHNRLCLICNVCITHLRLWFLVAFYNYGMHPHDHLL